MVSLLNLMQYDESLFSSITLPAGVDRDTLVNEILFEGAQLYPIHQDPALLKAMIKHYFSMRLQIHEELAKTLSYDYEPLENYDRQETRSHWETGKEDVERERSVETDTEAGTEGKVSAYNEDEYQPQNKTSSTSGTDTGEEETVGTTRSGNSGDTVRIHGNIGITTSQQMLESQRRVVQFSLYEYIASHFIRNFMIGIY